MTAKPQYELNLRCITYMLELSDKKLNTARSYHDSMLEAHNMSDPNQVPHTMSGSSSLSGLYEGEEIHSFI